MNDNRRQQLWENCRRLGAASSDEQKGKHILPAEAYISWLLWTARFGDERAREQADFPDMQLTARKPVRTTTVL